MLMREQNALKFRHSSLLSNPGCSSLLLLAIPGVAAVGATVGTTIVVIVIRDIGVALPLSRFFGDPFLVCFPLRVDGRSTSFAGVIKGEFALGQVAFATHALTPTVVVFFVQQVAGVFAGQWHDGLDVFPRTVERVAALQYELLGVALVASGLHEELIDVKAEAFCGEFFELLTGLATEALQHANTDVGSGD